MRYQVGPYKNKLWVMTDIRSNDTKNKLYACLNQSWAESEYLFAKDYYNACIVWFDGLTLDEQAIAPTPANAVPAGSTPTTAAAGCTSKTPTDICLRSSPALTAAAVRTRPLRPPTEWPIISRAYLNNTW